MRTTTKEEIEKTKLKV